MKKSIATFSLLILFACSLFGEVNKGTYRITCKLIGFNDGTVFSLVNLDKTSEKYFGYLKNNKLEFKGTIDEPTVFRLYPKDEKDAAIYMNFWVENRTITLIADKDNFANPIISGSLLNDTNRKVLGKYQNLEVERDNLMKKYLLETDGNEQESILRKVSEIDKKILETRLNTIANFEASLITIKELFFLRNDLSNDKLETLFEKFPALLKGTKYGKVLIQYLATGDIKIGAKAADIGGKDGSNQSVKLSDFKGKVILLDFWAAWCGPCRKSNKELVQIYRRFQSKGFEIVSFSTDTDQTAWQSASQIDGISWTNLSDLEGFYSKEVASYKVRSLPRAFLINKEGEIVHIFRGFDSKTISLLEYKISELTK